ncbi:hypothetical protein D3C87_1389310 [compost metagenome]
MQHDGFKACRHLDRADRVAAIDDVRRVGTGAERLLARLKAQWTAALEAIADAIRFRADGPGFGEKAVRRRWGQTVVVQPRYHPQGDLSAQRLTQRHGQTGPGATLAAGNADRQFITDRQPAPLKTTQRPQRISGTTAEHHWHIETAGHGQIGPRASLGEIKTQHLPGLHLEGGVQVHVHAIDLRRHVRTANRHQRVLLKFQLRPQQRAFQRRRIGRVAH